MKKILLVLFTVIALQLSGCASMGLKTGADITKVPVIVHADVPEPQQIPQPYLEVWNLNKNSTDDEIVRAYDSSLNAEIDYANQLKCALDAYRKSGSYLDNCEKMNGE